MKITGPMAKEMYDPAFDVKSIDEAKQYYELLVAYTMGYLAGEGDDSNLRQRARERVNQNLEFWHDMSIFTEGVYAMYLTFIQEAD